MPVRKPSVQTFVSHLFPLFSQALAVGTISRGIESGSAFRRIGMTRSGVPAVDKHECDRDGELDDLVECPSVNAGEIVNMRSEPMLIRKTAFPLFPFLNRNTRRFGESFIEMGSKRSSDLDPFLARHSSLSPESFPSRSVARTKLRRNDVKRPHCRLFVYGQTARDRIVFPRQIKHSLPSQRHDIRPQDAPSECRGLVEKRARNAGQCFIPDSLNSSPRFLVRLRFRSHFKKNPPAGNDGRANQTTLDRTMTTKI